MNKLDKCSLIVGTETSIATQTIKDHFSDKVYSASRKPSIMGDAAYQLMLRDSTECTGHFFIDEDPTRWCQ